ncbi:MAG: hypothetical protein ACUVRR_01885 [Candidatus Fervidibacter sp.]|uniref:hypothetical protein n=1 Tax=Candidatus Fervidibacter sp. TaxID=3100871 RepID=UPI0040491B47
MLLGWIVEDAVKVLLERNGFTCELIGADANRQLLGGHEILEAPDLKLITPDKEIWWLDVVTDYPTQKGAISYWQKKAAL